MKLLSKSRFILKETADTAFDILAKTPFFPFINKTITDISFNGSNIYFQSNTKGRYCLKIDFSKEDAFDFIKKVANVCDKNFSYSEPILDVSFDRYRLNAVHPLLAKNNMDGAITFAIRIIANRILINRRDQSFAPTVIHDLLKRIVAKEKSILISGPTGSGKTEMQKYLASFIKANSKLILIEDTYELFIKELFPSLDVNVWLYEDDERDRIYIDRLLKVALRNNPDWIIVAEVRGKEGMELIKGASSGAPFITTIHSESALENLHRLLLISAPQDFNNDSLLRKISNSIRIGVHMDKVYYRKKKRYVRYIREIVEYSYDEGIQAKYIYQSIFDHQECVFRRSYNQLSVQLAKSLDLLPSWYEGETKYEKV